MRSMVDQYSTSIEIIEHQFGTDLSGNAAIAALHQNATDAINELQGHIDAFDSTRWHR